MKKGTAERSEEWSSFGEASLRLRLEPGGEAVYTAPAGALPEKAAKTHTTFACHIYLESEVRREVTVTITLVGSTGKPWVITRKVRSDSTQRIVTTEQVDLGPLKLLKITTDAKAAVTLYVDDLGVS